MEKIIWAPIVSFAIVLITHLASRLIVLAWRQRKVQPAERQLAIEIKDILRQANALSTPSTFAKAAKLRRTAASKEKELAQLTQSLAKEQRWSKYLQRAFPTVLKAVAYIFLGYWFWGCPISTIAAQSIQPFDKAPLWKTKNFEDDEFIMIGIVPWLVLCTRVSVFLSKKAFKLK